MKHLDLPAPHGFLIWKGTQTAIALSEPLTESKYIITSNDEAFGVAQLSEPAQVKDSEFHKPMWQDEHRILPEERRLHFPGAETLYVYRIVGFKRYDELKPIENGQIVEPEPMTDEERALVEQGRKLPKQIVLNKEAVTFDGKNYHCDPDCPDLKKILEATYETDVTAADTPQPMSLYQLALVRVPNIRLKKTLLIEKQEGNSMPWEKVEDHPDCPADEPIGVVKEENGELEGCHANDAEANAQLAALNASEEDMEGKQVETKQQDESITQFVDRVHQQFSEMFTMMDEFGFADGPWVRDIYDSHIIASDDGKLYRVNYMDTDVGDIMFANRGAWVEVEVEYVDKAAKHLKSFTPPATPPKPDSTWLAKLKAAAKTVMEFVTLADKEADPPTLPALDLSAPCGVAVKDVDGKSWHFTWSTNAFEDREGEIFSTKALEDYVAESWTREDKGTFDFWHIPGSDFASKEWQGIVGRFLVEAGPYMDNEAGQRAKEFFNQYPASHPDIAPEGWGASPEFRYLPEDRADGVYDWLWITRTSTLPKAAAANIYTEGKQIMLSDDQRKAAVKIFGESFVTGLEEQGKQKTEDLEAADVAHKSEGKPEEAQPETEQAEEEAPAKTDMVNLDADALAEALSKQFEVNLEPFAVVIKEIGDKLQGLEARLTKMEKTEKVKQQTETPRYMFNLIRASEAVETAIDEKDKLNDQKPKEANAPGSVSSAFFSNQ